MDELANQRTGEPLMSEADNIASHQRIGAHDIL
jgi:hypothetical protein